MTNVIKHKQQVTENTSQTKAK